MCDRKECPKESFTCIWKFENFSHCTVPRGKSLSSVEFGNLGSYKRRWQLIFYPRGKDSFVECMLKIEKLEYYKIECMFCLYTSKRKILYTERRKLCFSSYSQVRVAKFGRDILENLPEDTLVIHCHISTNDSNKSENLVHQFASTRFCVQRILFNWKIDKFSSLSLGEKRVYCLPTGKKNLSSVSLELSLDGCNVENAFVQIRLKYDVGGVKEHTFSTCTLCVKDGNERIRKNIRQEYDLTLGECSRNFHIRRRELIAGGWLNDTLELSGEVTYPADSDEVFAFGLQTPEAVDAALGPASQYPRLAPSMDMLPLFKGEGPQPDFELRVAGRCFPVHQLVLWGRSTVFRAMLDNDMLEKTKRSVELQDMDSDTAERMIVYAYTGAEPSAALTWESLVSLYAAADRYAFMELKKICAERLVKILDPVNAPSVLQIADRHGDDQLKANTMEYIYSQGQVALESEQWMKLERDDSQLAVDILHQICDKFLS